MPTFKLSQIFNSEERVFTNKVNPAYDYTYLEILVGCFFKSGAVAGRGAEYVTHSHDSAPG